MQPLSMFDYVMIGERSKKKGVHPYGQTYNYTKSGRTNKYENDQ